MLKSEQRRRDYCAKQIVSLVKEGGRITGVGIAHQRDTEYQKAISNGNENDNLSKLPSVSPDAQS